MKNLIDFLDYPSDEADDNSLGLSMLLSLLNEKKDFIVKAPVDINPIKRSSRTEEAILGNTIIKINLKGERNLQFSVYLDGMILIYDPAKPSVFDVFIQSQGYYGLLRRSVHENTIASILLKDNHYEALFDVFKYRLAQVVVEIDSKVFS